MNFVFSCPKFIQIQITLDYT